MATEREKELFITRHNIFIRKAREACHQSLYFLGMLYLTNRDKATSAVDDYRIFALHQIKGLVRGVYIPSDCKKRIPNLNNIADADEKDAVRLCKTWNSIAEFLKDNPELPLNQIPGLRERLIDFLKESGEQSCWKYLIRNFFPYFLHYLRKNLSFIWGIVLVLFAFIQVEAINGLLRNEGWWILFPLFLLLVPILINRIFISTLLKRDPPVVPFWDIGGHALRSIREIAVAPGRQIEMWPDETPILREIIKGLFARISAYFIWWVVILLVLYIKGGSTVTVYAFLWMGLALLIVANVLDFWDFTSKPPVRFLVLSATIICTLFLFAGHGHVAFFIYFLTGAAVSAYVYVYKKLSAQKKKRIIYVVVAVILLVIATGIIVGHFTNKDQEWTSQSIEGGKLERLSCDLWPFPSKDGKPVVVMIASGGGSRAAVFTGLTLRHINEDKELKEVAQNLQAISSVSGGSLANAAYIARLLSVVKELGKDSYDSSRLKALKDLDEALSDDFLLPTLKGALLPLQTRGESIEEAWRKGPVQLGTYRLSDLVDEWQNAKKQDATIPPFPIPLFNTASLEGHDVVISPLSMNFYTQKELHQHASDNKTNYYINVAEKVNSEDDEPTWVFYRDGIYGLENFLNTFNPLLSSAVRASANFPFGFPLVKIKPQGKLYFSPVQDQESISLTDGGALSNSGMWSMFHLLMNNWESLEKRGVMLIIVDASKMPVYRDLQKSINSLIGIIQDQSTIGQNLHRRMYDLLKLKYGERIAIVKIDVIELQSYNVMTTWALDKDSIESLKLQFKETEKRWKEKKQEIKENWRILTGQCTRLPEPTIDSRRPPLD